MGPVQPPTLSDLSPLKVTGSSLSQDDRTIALQSGDRSAYHAGGVNPGYIEHSGDGVIKY